MTKGSLLALGAAVLVMAIGTGLTNGHHGRYRIAEIEQAHELDSDGQRVAALRILVEEISSADPAVLVARASGRDLSGMTPKEFEEKLGRGIGPGAEIKIWNAERGGLERWADEELPRVSLSTLRNLRVEAAPSGASVALPVASTPPWQFLSNERLDQISSEEEPAKPAARNF